MTRSAAETRTGEPQRRTDTVVVIRDEDGEFRSLKEIRAEALAIALSGPNGSLEQVAAKLKIGRSTLYRLIKVYKLEHFIDR